MKIFLCTVLSLIMLCISTEHATAENSLHKIAWQQVSDTELDTLRAGFLLENGMIVNIRYDKQLFINGDPVSNTYFDTADAVNLSTDLLPGNELRTVLQNNLNDQILSSFTHIDISLSRLGDVQKSMAQTHLYETLFYQNITN